MSLNVRLPTVAPIGTAGSAAGARGGVSAPRATTRTEHVRRGRITTSVAGESTNCRPSYRGGGPGGMTGRDLVSWRGRQPTGDGHGRRDRKRRGGGLGPGEGVAGGRPDCAGGAYPAIVGAGCR